MIECPCCGGELIELGTLGRRTHYRCRDCGAHSSEETNLMLPLGDIGVGDDPDIYLNKLRALATGRIIIGIGDYVEGP